MVDNKEIKVMNYGSSFIAVNGEHRSYGFEAARDGVPFVYYMPFHEVEYIDNRSPVFRTGALEFEPSVRESVFSKLGFVDWKDHVYFQSDIDDMIIHPTLEKMEKILKIKDAFTMERVRGRLTYFLNSNQYDISNRVSDIINERFREIRNGVRNTRITVKPIPNKESEEMKELRMQNDEMAKQLAEMKALMEKMMEKTESDSNISDTAKQVRKTAKSTKSAK